MRYSLLKFIECPVTKTPLVCLTLKERRADLPHYRLSPWDRINQAGAVVGPVPVFTRTTPLTEALRQQACASAPDQRNYEVEVEEGLLVSGESGRWYPIRNTIPEILPDHVRDFDRDLAFLREVNDRIPGRIASLLAGEQDFSGRARSDAGVRYKLAEMHILEKITDPSFFGPGYLSPFNPHTTGHTAHLIKLFALCLSTLQANNHRIVLDTGCGYAWTTEWLLRAGLEPIGIDITRAYMEIGLQRFGIHRPYLVIGDTENLPIRSQSADAVLGFDSFHHIPDRRRAMQEFDRVLVPGGEVVLGEPGGAHERDPGAQAVMEKYGILERGMELPDVEDYVRGTQLGHPEQDHVVRIAHGEMGARLTPDFLASHSWTVWNLYRLRKEGK